MYAIIETGGQQYRVSPGTTIKVQKIGSGNETEISIDRVLFVSNDDGIMIGKPTIKNASVKAEIVGTAKSEKILVFKKKPRKGYKKLNGHRQSYTTLKIKDIVVGG